MKNSEVRDVWRGYLRIINRTPMSEDRRLFLVSKLTEWIDVQNKRKRGD